MYIKCYVVDLWLLSFLSPISAVIFSILVFSLHSFSLCDRFVHFWVDGSVLYCFVVHGLLHTINWIESDPPKPKSSKIYKIYDTLSFNSWICIGSVRKRDFFYADNNNAKCKKNNKRVHSAFEVQNKVSGIKCNISFHWKRKNTDTKYIVNIANNSLLDEKKKQQHWNGKSTKRQSSTKHSLLMCICSMHKDVWRHKHIYHGIQHQRNNNK